MLLRVTKCFGANQAFFFLGLPLFLPLPRWEENSRTSGNSWQGRAVVGVVSFFASHKYVASHCVHNRFQNDAVPMTPGCDRRPYYLNSVKVHQ